MPDDALLLTTCTPPRCVHVRSPKTLDDQPGWLQAGPPPPPYESVIAESGMDHPFFAGGNFAHHPAVGPHGGGGPREFDIAVLEPVKQGEGVSSYVTYKVGRAGLRQAAWGAAGLKLVLRGQVEGARTVGWAGGVREAGRSRRAAAPASACGTVRCVVCLPARVT